MKSLRQLLVEQPTSGAQHWDTVENNLLQANEIVGQLSRRAADLRDKQVATKVYQLINQALSEIEEVLS